jgi:hypothetical protein
MDLSRPSTAHRGTSGWRGWRSGSTTSTSSWPDSPSTTLPILSEPKELVLGVTRVRVVCFRDPDGVLLEYLEFVNRPWGS